MFTNAKLCLLFRFPKACRKVKAASHVRSSKREAAPLEVRVLGAVFEVEFVVFKFREPRVSWTQLFDGVPKSLEAALEGLSDIPVLLFRICGSINPDREGGRAIRAQIFRKVSSGGLKLLSSPFDLLLKGPQRVTACELF
jgi:hypothetical protein